MVMKFIRRSYISLVFLFLYAPILVLIVYSFNDSKSRGNWNGFTLKWYASLLKNDAIMNALYNTLTIALLSAIIATIIGTAAAIGIHNLGGIRKTLVMNATYLPVVNADIVTGISLMLLFRFANIRFGYLSLLLAHITFNIPYVILSVMPKLRQLNKHLFEAAQDLGATPLYSFRKVILPEIMPGVITGMLLSFTLSIDDFVISFFTKGEGVSNLSITIYSMARRGIKPEINALSTIMFVTVLALLLIVNMRMSKDNKKRKQLQRGSK